MEMADARLKLSIITALDNAGIKATKEQVSSLEKQLKSVNGTSTSLGSSISETFKKSMEYIKAAAGGFALFWLAGPKLFKFFEDVQNNSKGMAEGVKDAFSNMAESIGEATLEHFGVLKELNNATDAYKKGLDLQIKGVDKLVSGTAKLQDNLTNNLSTFEHISGVIGKVEDSMDNINIHANNLQQSAFNDYLEDVGATQEEKNIANALFRVDDASEKQRQAVRSRNRKLDLVDTQIDKAQKDAEIQQKLVDDLQRKVNASIAVEKQMSSYDPNSGRLKVGSDLTWYDGIGSSLIGSLFDGLVGEKVQSEQENMIKSQVEQRRKLEEKLSSAKEVLTKKVNVLDKLEAARVGIDAETSRDVINASNDVRYMISRYDRLSRIQDPTQMTDIDWKYNERVIGSALQKLDFDIPNKHLERIEENTKELSDLKNYLQELLSIK